MEREIRGGDESTDLHITDYYGISSIQYEGSAIYEIMITRPRVIFHY